MFNGVKINNLFIAKLETLQTADSIEIYIKEAAIFINIISFNNVFQNIPRGKTILIHLNKAIFIDSSFQEFLHHYKTNYEQDGSEVKILEKEEFRKLSEHEMSILIHK
jgi:TusA-related sulfurtransferase